MHPRWFRSLSGTILLLCTILGCTVAGCGKPVFPPSALKRADEGITELAFAINGDGTVTRTLVLNASGSAELDKAAIDAVSTCVFSAEQMTGVMPGHWQSVVYVWSTDKNWEMKRTRNASGRAAAAGHPAAFYYLSLVLMNASDSANDHELGRELRETAAALGHPRAQYVVGQAYEDGDGVPADSEQARYWYGKAAAQGDILALQRLQAAGNTH